MAKKLRAGGVVILGKVGLSEFANYFGSQPSGFSNLTGQVLNVQDADQSPSGSSSGERTGGRGRPLDAQHRHLHRRLDQLARRARRASSA